MMQTPRFQRTKEDFACEHCGAHVEGDGYTNHCPKCLWSKHVDINPGDRSSSCGGMMEPVAIEGSTPRYRILHRCAACGFEKRNDMHPSDDMQAALALGGEKR
jgi:hypothetical protein